MKSLIVGDFLVIFQPSDFSVKTRVGAPDYMYAAVLFPKGIYDSSSWEVEHEWEYDTSIYDLFEIPGIIPYGDGKVVLDYILGCVKERIKI